MPVVRIEPINDAARELWNAALDLADELPERGWALVGGLMVQLHAYRFGQAGARPTEDIDILADSRQRPASLTELIAQRLLQLGYKVAQQTGLIGPSTIYRFERGDETVDILGPDGMKKSKPKTIGNSETIQVPAGTQALTRTEAVRVEVAGGRSGTLRCPRLVASTLLKARAIQSTQRDQDRQDLIVLLSCIAEPLHAKRELSKSEVRWLRDASPKLRIDDDDLADLFPAEQLARARATYRLLTAPRTSA